MKMEQFERKFFTIVLPLLLAGIIYLTTNSTQNYQMGSEEKTAIPWAIEIVSFLLIIFYFLLPLIGRKRNWGPMLYYFQAMVIYIVAFAEGVHFIISHSIGGLQTPEFTFLHLPLFAFYFIFTVIYAARMYSPKRLMPSKIKKRIFISLVVFTFLSQWVAIPQMLQPQIQSRFESTFKDHLGTDFENEIPAAYRDKFGDGLFHVDAFMEPVTYDHEELRDLVVHDYGNFQVKLHWFMPTGLQPNETRPTLLTIHGGGFIMGNGSDLDQQTMCEWWTSRGYVVGSVDYRLSPAARFPAAIEDIRRTLVYMKENAAMLHIDINRTALLGRSAGATLAVNALSNNTWLYENTGRINRTDMIPIRALIVMYPVVNFVELMTESWGFYNLVYRYGPYENYLGASISERPELYEYASPKDSLYPNFPPMLVIGAGLDMLTPKKDHYDPFIENCTERGLDIIALQIPWANHAFDILLTSRSGVLCTYAWERFCGYHLAR